MVNTCPPSCAFRFLPSVFFAPGYGTRVQRDPAGPFVQDGLESAGDNGATDPDDRCDRTPEAFPLGTRGEVGQRPEVDRLASVHIATRPFTGNQSASIRPADASTTRINGG
jgi:hypothetical protein